MVDSRVLFGYDVVDGERVPRRVSMLELGFTPARDLATWARSAFVAGVTFEGATVWRVGSDGGGFSFDVAGENRAGEIAGGPVEPGEWSHVAITRPAGTGPVTARLYLDGAEAAGGDAWVPEDAGSHLQQLWLHLGRNLDGQPKQYFGGRMAQLRVWNHARSSDEIARHHRSRVDVGSPGLVGVWPLRDPVGPGIEDVGVNGLHGTRGGSGS